MSNYTWCWDTLTMSLSANVDDVDVRSAQPSWLDDALVLSLKVWKNQPGSENVWQMSNVCENVFLCLCVCIILTNYKRPVRKGLKANSKQDSLIHDLEVGKLKEWITYYQSGMEHITNKGLWNLLCMCLHVCVFPAQRSSRRSPPARSINAQPCPRLICHSCCIFAFILICTSTLNQPPICPKRCSNLIDFVYYRRAPARPPPFS